MPRKRRDNVDQDLIRALNHPLRVQILELLGGEVLSPKLISKRLSEPLGDVAYHVKVLKECGCIELAQKVPRRGATEHFFRPAARSFIGHQALRSVPRAVRSAISCAALSSFFERAASAIEAGTVDAREDTPFSWATIRVDESGWDEAVQVLTAAQGQAEQIHKRSSARLKKAGASGIPMIVGIAGFEIPPMQKDTK